MAAGLSQFTTPCAGIPTLCNQSMLHVDPESWTIALSPDRAALVVFIRGQDHSLSSLLSAPVRVSVSTPQEHLSMHEQNERTWIDAMTFAGKPYPLLIGTAHGLSDNVSAGCLQLAH